MRILITLLLILLGCSTAEDPMDTGNGNGNGDGDGNPGNNSYEVVEAFPNLSFNQPVDLQHPGDGSNRLFVVEKPGIIKAFQNDSTTGSSSTFLDIRDLVDDSGGEEGLLGLAFHPDFDQNGYFYVNYTAADPSRTVIARYRVTDPNGGQADPSTQQVVLQFAQPYDNHNGGQLAFGPDGYLYIAVGDGGSGGDPQGNGQDRSTLLGSILRIDVDNPTSRRNYGIPSSNPYANSDQYREEIFAYGLRNPWRFSFDPETDELWAADVGQNSYEEVDLIEAGQNYGWNIMEGNHCYEPSSGCDQTGLTLPVWEYSHDEGNSITGGYVYRGNSLTALVGRYIYADFGSGRIWALDNSTSGDPANTELINSDLSITSFGTDANNELYICDIGGKIYKLQASN